MIRYDSIEHLLVEMRGFIAESAFQNVRTRLDQVSPVTEMPAVVVSFGAEAARRRTAG